MLIIGRTKSNQLVFRWRRQEGQYDMKYDLPFAKPVVAEGGDN